MAKDCKVGLFELRRKGHCLHVKGISLSFLALSEKSWYSTLLSVKLPFLFPKIPFLFPLKVASQRFLLQIFKIK